MYGSNKHIDYGGERRRWLTALFVFMVLFAAGVTGTLAQEREIIDQAAQYLLEDVDLDGVNDSVYVEWTEYHNDYVYRIHFGTSSAVIEDVEYATPKGAMRGVMPLPIEVGELSAQFMRLTLPALLFYDSMPLLENLPAWLMEVDRTIVSTPGDPMFVTAFSFKSDWRRNMFKDSQWHVPQSYGVLHDKSQPVYSGLPSWVDDEIQARFSICWVISDRQNFIPTDDQQLYSEHCTELNEREDICSTAHAVLIRRDNLIRPIFVSGVESCLFNKKGGAPSEERRLPIEQVLTYNNHVIVLQHDGEDEASVYLVDPVRRVGAQMRLEPSKQYRWATLEQADIVGNRLEFVFDNSRESVALEQYVLALDQMANQGAAAH